ncbi:MAG: hypothetical protein V4665_03620 [Patescibacteria group bacterium]
MRNPEDKKKLLEILSETPSILYACRKVGIVRATFYRWCADDEDFHFAVKSAIKYGRQNDVDVIEMRLTKKAKEGDLNAIKFFLEHNDDRYKKYRPRENPYDFDPMPFYELSFAYFDILYGRNFDPSATLNKEIEIIDISDSETGKDRPSENESG